LPVVRAAGDRIKTSGDILDYPYFFVADEQLAYDEKAVAKALETANAAIAKLDTENAILKLSDDEKKWMDKKKKTDIEKAAFAKKSPDDRKKEMEDDKDDEDVEKVALRKRIEVLEKADNLSKFNKRAVELGLPESFGETLMKAHGGDPAAVTLMESQISALQKQVNEAGLFGEIGRVGKANGTGSGTAYDEMMTLAKNLRTVNPTAYAKMSDAQLFSKVYEDPANAALVQKHNTENARRIAAA